MTGKRKFALVIFFIFASAAALFVAQKALSPLLHAANPGSYTEFSSSEKPVYFKANGVTFKVPKAYLHYPHEMEGGTNSFSIRAAKEPGLPAWTLSQAYKNKDSKAALFVEVTAVMKKYDSLEDYVYASFYQTKQSNAGHLKRKQVTFEMGTYKDVFNRYVQNLYPSGSLASFYLRPIEKTERPYLIECTASGNPEYILCNTQAAFWTKNSIIISYRYSVPLRNIEQYREYDKQVLPLVKSFIEGENLSFNSASINVRKNPEEAS